LIHILENIKVKKERSREFSGDVDGLTQGVNQYICPLVNQI